MNSTVNEISRQIFDQLSIDGKFRLSLNKESLESAESDKRDPFTKVLRSNWTLITQRALSCYCWKSVLSLFNWF